MRRPRASPIEKNHHTSQKCFECLHEINLGMFTIISAIERTTFHPSSTIGTYVNIFVYVFLFLHRSAFLLTVQTSRFRNNMCKYFNYVNNSGREMEFGSLDKGTDGELISARIVEISKIFGNQDDFFHGAMLFARFYTWDFQSRL